MDGESHTTTDHEAIRQWTEARGGEPGTVGGTPGAKRALGRAQNQVPASERRQ